MLLKFWHLMGQYLFFKDIHRFLITTFLEKNRSNPGINLYSLIRKLPEASISKNSLLKQGTI
jgi:hypothetical protein